MLRVRFCNVDGPRKTQNLHVRSQERIMLILHGEMISSGSKCERLDFGRFRRCERGADGGHGQLHHRQQGVGGRKQTRPDRLHRWNAVRPRRVGRRGARRPLRYLVAAKPRSDRNKLTWIYCRQAKMTAPWAEFATSSARRSAAYSRASPGWRATRSRERPAPFPGCSRPPRPPAAPRPSRRPAASVARPPPPLVCPGGPNCIPGLIHVLIGAHKHSMKVNKFLIRSVDYACHTLLHIVKTLLLLKCFSLYHAAASVLNSRPGFPFIFSS